MCFFAGNFCPQGYRAADGTLLPIQQNQALFSILGATYGGDGRTNFALPDLRGRGPVGSGTGTGLAPVGLGQILGNEKVTLTANQIAPHTHPATFSGGSFSGLKAEGTSGGTLSGNAPGTNSVPITGTVTGTVTVNPNTFVNNQQSPVPTRSPSLGLTACIADQGTYPMRP